MKIVVAVVTVMALWPGVTGTAQVQPSWGDRADTLLRQPVHGCPDLFAGKVSGLDAEGYGNTAWSLSYALEALTVRYATTGDRAFLDAACRVARSLMQVRDDRLAERGAQGTYLDYARSRVMRAWGTGTYSQGRHTCWLVHQGMLLYPVAECVRLVRGGGRKTADLAALSRDLERDVREVIAEFDGEWRDGPRPGMGYYVDPAGKVLPNNYQSAMGRVYLALGDRASRDRAARIRRYIRSKLTLDAARDCWLWSYSQKGPDGPPGTGEDISHAAITGHFLYLCWERRAGFTRKDAERLARTVTRAIHIGDGTMAGTLGGTGAGQPEFTAQCGRWGHLAEIDSAVADGIAAYVTHPPVGGAPAGPTGALSFAYVAHALRPR